MVRKVISKKKKVVQKRVDSKSRTNFPRGGKLFVFTGPSGAGKTTLAQAVLKEVPHFVRLVTCTTRAMRVGEHQDVDYHFISREAFAEMIVKGELLEYATVYDNYYGSRKSDVEQILSLGKSILVVLDVQGALTMQRKFPEAITIFIKAPSIAVLKKRLLARGKDTPQVIEQRLVLAKEELTLEHAFTHVLVNDVLSDAITQIKHLVELSLTTRVLPKRRV